MSDPPTTLYSYRLFDITLVQELYRHKPQLRPNAYLSEDWDGELNAIRQAVIDGYRWSRSEGDLAVFERQVPAPQLLNALIPRHIAAQTANGNGDP